MARLNDEEKRAAALLISHQADDAREHIDLAWKRVRALGHGIRREDLAMAYYHLGAAEQAKKWTSGRVRESLEYALEKLDETLDEVLLMKRPRSEQG